MKLGGYIKWNRISYRYDSNCPRRRNCFLYKKGKKRNAEGTYEKLKDVCFRSESKDYKKCIENMADLVSTIQNL